MASTRTRHSESTAGNTGVSNTVAPPRISMRFVVSACAVFLIVATVVAMGVVEDRSIRRLLTAEIHNRLLLQARNLGMLSEDALLSDYPELVLQPIVNQMLEESPELAFVYIVDHQDRLRGHPDSRRLGTEFDASHDLGDVTLAELPKGEERLLAHGGTIAALSPAMHDSSPHLGTAVVGIDQAYLLARIADARRAKIFTALVLLGGGIVCALALMTWLLRPLRAVRRGLERIGRGDLETPIELNDQTELGQLAHTVNDMAARLRDAQAELVDRERLLYEMELAKRIQRSLLPTPEQTIGEFSIRGAQKPAAEVGGDYYDIFELDRGRIGLVIADVAGKGLAGCLATSMLAAFVRVYRAEFESPADMLAAVEAQLEATLPRGTFVTMFYGILDPSYHTMTFASAGHSPTAIYRAENEAVEWLNPRGSALALSRLHRVKSTREDRTIELGRGDVLVQYTDGVNEAWDTTGEHQFGFDNLERIIKTHGGEGSGSILVGVRDAVAEWSKDQPPSDDETLLIVGYDTLKQPPLEREIGAATGATPATTTATAAASATATAAASAIDAAVTEAFDLAAFLTETRAYGDQLNLPIDLKSLSAIRFWTQHCKFVRRMSRSQINVVNVLLHEVCANIIEHGYEPGERSEIVLYWLPSRTLWNQDDADLEGELAVEALAHSSFMIADRGSQFDPNAWNAADHDREAVEKRGRGLGLPIIHRVTSRIDYQPGTEFGNLTLLRFEPREVLLAGGSS